MAKELYEEVITARIAAVGVEPVAGWGAGHTRIPHRLLGVPNEIEILDTDGNGGSTLANVGLVPGGTTATYVEVVNDHAGSPTIRLRVKRYKSDQADIGMSTGYDYHDPAGLVTTPTTSDGVDNYGLGKIYNARSGT